MHIFYFVMETRCEPVREKGGGGRESEDQSEV